MSTLATSLTKILGSANVDTTNCPTIYINHRQTNQVNKKQMAARFMTYADTVAEYDTTTSKWIFSDIVAGNGSTVTFDDFEFDKQSGQHQGQVYGRFVARYNIKEFRRTTSNAPQLADLPQFLSESTGRTGEDSAIDVASFPTTISGGQVVYNNSGISTVLSRKVTLHNKVFNRITVKGFQNIDIGTRIEATSDKTSLWFILLRKKFNLKTLTTELAGLGEITPVV